MIAHLRSISTRKTPEKTAFAIEMDASQRADMLLCTFSTLKVLCNHVCTHKQAAVQEVMGTGFKAMCRSNLL